MSTGIMRVFPCLLLIATGETGCGLDSIIHDSPASARDVGPEVSSDAAREALTDARDSVDGRGTVIRCPDGQEVQLEHYLNCVTLYTQLAEQCCPRYADLVKTAIAKVVCSNERIDDTCRAALDPPTFAASCDALKAVPLCL